MPRLKAAAAVAALLLLALGSAAAQRNLSGRELVEELRRGGYAIYFRHAATDWSQQDHVEEAGDWRSCDPERMRQLSRRGRAQARRIGEHMRELAIPVGLVLSSEYCRARESARLMMLGSVTPTRSLMNMRAAAMNGGRRAVIDRARNVIGRQPGPGTNTVLVAHGNLMRAATGAYALEAGAVVFKPGADGTFALVAQVAPDQWAELAGLFD